MKFLLTILFLMSFGFSESPLSDRYHTYDEIRTQLFAWDDEFGNSVNTNYPNGGIMYELIEIGKSHEDELPFWAVKLSYNLDQEIDKPKILFLGQCHAEEILGVEISMALIDILLYPTPQTGTENLPYPNGYRPSFGDLSSDNIMSILETTEVWVVPTHNPEGLSVVHGFDDNGTWVQDETYRKNKHDLDGNNIFDFIVGQGNDSDGVDLNRNYDFNWIFGDGIYEPDSEGCNPSYFTDYDYYRGPSAFSESELQAIRDLALEENFLVSIAYHSSRSGCLSEKVKYSWEWSGTKYPPDKNILSNLGENIAGLIGRVDSGTYEPSFSGSFKGVAHNWFYAKTGCFQYLIEVGEGYATGGTLQPSETSDINSIIYNNLQGAFYAINRTAGLSSGNLGADSYMVSGIVSNNETGLPILGAEVKILEMDSGVLSPRLTDQFGRYRRLLIDESYTVQVNALGFISQEITITPSSSSITDRNFSLEPILTSELNITVTDIGSLSEEIFLQLTHVNGLIDTIALQLGNQSIEYPIGDYLVFAFADGKFPQFFQLDHGLEGSLLNLDLKYENLIYNQTLDNIVDWNIDNGDWVNGNWKIKSQAGLKYSSNLDQIISVSPNLSFEDGEKYALKLEIQYELEWEQDSLIIELINGDGVFSTIEISDQNWENHLLYIPIPNQINSLTQISFRIISDGSVNYRGFSLNNLSIIKSSNSLDLSNDISKLHSFKLDDNFPNPFNPSTLINFQLGQLSSISLKIYDLRGHLIETLLDDGIRTAGLYEYTFNGSQLASGIYFYELRVDGSRVNKKMLLIK
ncbi:MAG: T9SS type A sorting domain-containing protein [Candidatus Marinimicrobia bacterium]|nr:T9SS type A sorting domain-containing protein [Candidatus Neomarinimicrobiota bacterium]